MTTLFSLHGVNEIALLNTGLGVMRAAMGESTDQICSSPSSCYVESDGNEVGRLDSPLLSIERPPLSARPIKGDSRAIDVIRDELFEIFDLTSGALRSSVINATRGLQIEQFWLFSKVVPHLEEEPHSTREEINTLITNIRERKRRPEFQAYAAALARFQEANSSLNALRKRLVETKDPFPPEELRNLLESVWHANERALVLQQEMNSYREAVIEAWRAADLPNP